MRKSNYPGQLTAAKQVNSRVIPDISSSGHMSLSTGRKYLQREAADRPENEDEIRGVRICREAAEELLRRRGPEMRYALEHGIIEVV